MVEKEELKQNLEKIENRIDEICRRIGSEREKVKLIPVSKTFAPDILKNAQDAGSVRFGESYAQELKSKFEWFEENNLKQPEWHFIGHLQRNKVKYIAPFVKMIHAVDSLRLAREINKQAEKNERKIDILVQINTSGEESKFGFDPEIAKNEIKEIDGFENIDIKGLMTIAGLDATIEENRKEFQLLAKLKNEFTEILGKNLNELSMGMSGDFEAAIEEGSTMVRVGTAIFGEREYKK